MPTFTEPARIGDVLKREYDALFNREVKDVTDGQDLAMGAVVAEVSGALVAWNPDGSDGSELAVGVLLEPVTASGSTEPGVMLARGPAVVSREALVFASGTTSGEIDDAVGQLAELGIVSRTEVGGEPVSIGS